MKKIIIIDKNATNATKKIGLMLDKKNDGKSQSADNQQKCMLSHVNFG